MMTDSRLITQLHFRYIYFKGRRFDQQVICDAIDHLAKFLNSHNRSASPFILLAAYSHIKTIIAYYAIIKAGKIPALLDPGHRSIELAEIIEDIDPAAIIFLNSSEIGFMYEEEIIFRRPKPGFIITSDLTDVCTLAFTNAEDGYSKGAMLTEKNLMSEIRALVLTNRLTAGSVTCALLPFYHLYGLVQGILVPTHAGSAGVIIELDILRINETVNQIRQNQVTHLYTVPSLYYILSKVTGIDHLVKDIHEFYSGGIQLSPFIYESFFKKTNRKIREGYGLTECSPGVGLDYENESPVVSSFGKPLPGCDIKILDDLNRECLPGHTGEICISGDMVFKGYFNHTEATDRVLKDGWLHSGDYGKKDLEGNIYFCGVKKDMINVAGNNVYPRKLERLLKINRMVAEVDVFHEDSVLQGQVVGAKFRLHKRSESAHKELKDWCYENINNIILPKIWLFEHEKLGA
jgi:long-chain acyl-CoA synthetase